MKNLHFIQLYCTKLLSVYFSFNPCNIHHVKRCSKRTAQTCLLQTREHPSLLPDPLLKPFHGYLCYESPFQASTTNLQVRISISLPSLLRIFLPLFFFCCFGPFCGLSVAVWLLFLLLLLFLFLFGHVCWPWWCFRPPFSLSPPPIAVGGLGGEWAASSFFFFRAHWAEADLTLSLQRPFFGGGGRD
ncbi:hypothetical protein Cgig2_018748 [Carnegiea gigantea]|uniref:Uncharacterized protein n=1 Tax=Carnegiea gigantea TaxID=171969 RepID=A0A9Q1JVJ0_9CARY|nr:hypothetical protein Cgig2_018748 [Carnegiea gigantea]